MAANEIIEPYLRAENVDELYTYMLEHGEQRCGQGLLRELLRLLWASRNGLTCQELTALMGHLEHQVADTVTVLQNHLLWNGPTVSLTRPLRVVVEKRYLATRVEQRKIHLTIAEHFAQQPLTVRRLEEQPWQLHTARAWRELLSTIVRPAFALALHEINGSTDLFYYWNAIEKHMALTEEYEARLESSRNNDDECLGAAMLYRLLGEFHRDRGNEERAERLLHQSMKIRLAICGNDDRAAELPLFDRIEPRT